MTPGELAEALRASYPDVLEVRGEVTLVVDRADLLTVLHAFKADGGLSFDFLSDIAATDWPGRSPRLWVAYHLYSMSHRHRLRLKVGVTAEDPHVPSVTGPFPTADWLEREVYDFFGVIFDGHPDLRRIELPESWTTFPLRKDHPLEGVAVRYGGGRFIPPPDQRDT